MPLIYIHGVNVRSPDHGIALEQAFQRWLGPRLGEALDYEPVYWGDLVQDEFRWNLASRPRTRLLGLGGEGFDPLLGPAAVAAAPQAARALDNVRQPRVDDNVLGGSQAPEPPAATHRIAEAPADRRADLVADLYVAAALAEEKAHGGEGASVAAEGGLAEAAERVAERWHALVAPGDPDPDNAARLVAAMQLALEDGNLLAGGALADLAARAREVAARAFAMPGDVVSTLLAEARPVLNGFVSRFFGDVLTYLSTRGTAGAPGPIASRVVASLVRAIEIKRRTGRPIVVVSHSMGGQLLYDAVTYFADALEELHDLKIDHWFTCGSQVSFFAELAQFPAQDPAVRAPRKLRRPDRIDAWTNFYDPNDFVGFVMEGVFDGVVDIAYDTGFGLALAHTGYLTRPSFFRALADRL